MPLIRKKSVLGILLLTALLAACEILFSRSAEAADPAGKTDGAYLGVCSHLGGDAESAAKLKKIAETPIRLVRSDFWWSRVQRKDGSWNFDGLDRLVDEAEKNGVEILPILSQSEWFQPTAEHLDDWREYVRRVVSRYQKRIRKWEVINEVNLDSLRGEGMSPEDYAAVLAAAYETIKKIDPELIVVHGGLAGTPPRWFEAELKAGAGKSFDVMNVHCYRGGMRTRESVEWFRNDLKKITGLMTRYGVGEKPLWITEMGWSSLPDFCEINRLILTTSLPILFPAADGRTFAYLYDEKYRPGLFYRPEALRRMFPPEAKVEKISLNDLVGVSPEKYAAILLPPGEAFPSDHFDDFVRYVQDGGVLLLLGGVPLRYGVEKQGEEFAASKTEADAKFRRAFGLAYQAKWLDPSVPKITRTKIPDALLANLPRPMLELLDGFADTYQCSRFLANLDDRLDSAVPLFFGSEGDFSAPVVEIIQPKGFRGRLLVSTINELETTNIATAENQAVYLPQTILTALASGVERTYWYELQSPEGSETDKEDHFGLTHRDLSPKPAYFALQTLLDARPDGSRPTAFSSEGDVILAGWKRPDGRNGFALWTPDGRRRVKLGVVGGVERAFDYLGKEVKPPVDSERVELTPNVLYLIGPESVTLTPDGGTGAE